MCYWQLMAAADVISAVANPDSTIKQFIIYYGGKTAGVACDKIKSVGQP